MQNADSFVRWFRQVAPYVHDFGGRTFVIGFGGEMVAERQRFASFIHDVNLLAALEIRLVLVYGARPQIEAELKEKGLKSQYAQGLRVTDEPALTVVKHAGGALRVEIEALLSQGLPNSPMARAGIRVVSGNYITARPIGVRKGIDFQFTGAVRKVDAAALSAQLDVADIVLVPFVGYSPTGEVFNLAWEDVAESVAVALKADKLLMYTDKLPTNWLFVGAIRAMLPQARIVIVRRDPLENCLACWRFLFNHHAYTHDFGDLAAYWREFDRATRQWQAAYPDRVRVQVYENLVAEPEAQIRALLEFCGLPFEAACLDFHATERRVTTPSAAQVREPLRSDTARAAKYGALLDPLRAALGMPQFQGP